MWNYCVMTWPPVTILYNAIAKLLLLEKKESMGKVKIIVRKTWFKQEKQPRMIFAKKMCKRRKQQVDEWTINLLDRKSDNHIFKLHLYLTPSSNSIITVSILGFISIYCLVYTVHQKFAEMPLRMNSLFILWWPYHSN